MNILYNLKINYGMLKLFIRNEKPFNNNIIEESILWNENGAQIAIDVWEDISELTLKEWINSQSKRLGLENNKGKEIFISVNNIPALMYSFDSEGIQAYNSKMTFFKYNYKIFRVTYLEKDFGALFYEYEELLKLFEFKVNTQELESNLSNDTNPPKTLVYS